MAGVASRVRAGLAGEGAVGPRHGKSGGERRVQGWAGKSGTGRARNGRTRRVS